MMNHKSYVSVVTGDRKSKENNLLLIVMIFNLDKTLRRFDFAKNQKVLFMNPFIIRSQYVNMRTLKKALIYEIELVFSPMAPCSLEHFRN